MLLFSLFVVVGGAAVLMYMKFSETDKETAQTPPPAKIEAAAPKAPAAKPPAPKPPPPPPTKPPEPVAAPVVQDVAVSLDAGVPAEPAPEPEPEPPTRTLADNLRCPAGMAKVVLDAGLIDTADAAAKKAAFCMDAYEYPGMGQKPKTKINMGSSKKLCKKAGKQLCSVAQWKKACAATYPYGDTYKAGACNVEGAIKETGSFPDCVTPSGIYDLVGNASEWASDKRLHGGDTAGGKGNTCSAESKRFLPGPTNGFRCCADALR